MRFEESEKVYTDRGEAEVLDIILRNFKKCSEAAKISSREIELTAVGATFGSINRKDRTAISIENIRGGYDIVADVRYKPSALFWIFCVIGLFFTFLWLIPVGFYFWHYKLVKDAIRSTLKRIGEDINMYDNEPYFDSNRQKQNSYANSTDELLKLAALRERGYLTDEEFIERKARLN